MQTEIHIFDMDHTLIDNDCDVSWKQFLVEKKLATQDALHKADYFYQQYRRNQLELTTYLEFQLAEFRGKTKQEMAGLAAEHFHKFITPRIFTDAAELIRNLQDDGYTTAICTSTNSVVAAPLAQHLNIPHLLATEPEIKNGSYTGRITGTYAGGEGKVQKVSELCKKNQSSFREIAYYGDSLSDVPLLNQVIQPVAVNPDDKLLTIARENDWPIKRWQS